MANDTASRRQVENRSPFPWWLATRQDTLGDLNVDAR